MRNGRITVAGLARLLEEYDQENLWVRELGIAEEDRARLTTSRWKPGEFRFFRSHNVVPIEVARELRDRVRIRGCKS
jgi:hypothetical protein